MHNSDSGISDNDVPYRPLLRWHCADWWCLI